VHTHERRKFGENVDCDDPGVEAAARAIYAAGQFHGWSGFSKPFDALDPTGRIEFMAVINRGLKAADVARKLPTLKEGNAAAMFSASPEERS
jgi:hypothetical protein